MSDKTNAAQAGAAVPTTDADGRLDLHAVFRLQEECGYTRDLVLDAYSAQRLTGRLRGITALTGVLMAGDSLEVSLGEAAALREALRLALAALEKVIDDGCAIEAHDRMTIDGDTWTIGGVCALAHDALASKEA